MPEKHGIEFSRQCLEGNVAADIDIQAEFDAHVLHDLAALLDDLFLQLERRDAEGQQAADLRIAVEHHRRHAVAHQDIGAGEARGARAHDGHALARAHHIRHVGLPALLECLVRDVFLDGADAHRADAVIQRARALAQPILRADAAAHFRQRIGLMRQLRRLEQLAVIDQRQPVRNVIVNRAFPLAEWVAAGNAASRLLRRRLGAVLGINFAKFLGAHLHGSLSGSLRGMSRNCRCLSAMRFELRRGLKPRAADFPAANRWPPPWASPPRICRCSCENH